MERSEYKMVFVILTWTRQARVRRGGMVNVCRCCWWSFNALDNRYKNNFQSHRREKRVLLHVKLSSMRIIRNYNFWRNNQETCHLFEQKQTYWQWQRQEQEPVLLMVIGLSVGFVFSVSTLSREDTDTRAGIMGWMKRYTAYTVLLDRKYSSNV